MHIMLIQLQFLCLTLEGYLYLEKHYEFYFKVVSKSLLILSQILALHELKKKKSCTNH